jgi:hypothetical protein
VGTPESLQVSLRLSSKGTTPVALSQEQFAVIVSRPGMSDLYADASFTTNSPRVFTVQPNTSLSISLGASTNDLRFIQAWKALKPGKYQAQVHIGSGKTRLFDYEFMGQRHSNTYEFEIR